MSSWTCRKSRRAHGGNVEREAREALAQQAVVVVALYLRVKEGRVGVQGGVGAELALGQFGQTGRGCRGNVEQRLVAEGSEQVVGDDFVEEVF